jgi:hypothetical protein
MNADGVFETADARRCTRMGLPEPRSLSPLSGHSSGDQPRCHTGCIPLSVVGRQPSDRVVDALAGHLSWRDGWGLGALGQWPKAGRR